MRIGDFDVVQFLSAIILVLNNSIYSELEKGAYIQDAGSSTSNASHEDPNPKDVAVLPDAEPLLDKLSPQGNTRNQEGLESNEGMYEYRI